MRISTIIPMFAVIALSGCAGLGGAMQYSDTKPVHFVHDGSTWRIFDKPGERRLMITPTVMDAAASGAIGGATFGIAGDPFTGRSAGIPRNKFSAAADAWVKRHGASCEITSEHLLVTPQWEYEYAC